MLKKLILGFLLLFIFLITLIFININIILNSSQFKEKISNFLKENYRIELNYKKLKLDLLEKRVILKDFFLKFSNYEIFLPEGNLIFSLDKFLEFRFSPEKIYINNSRIKIYKTKKPFNIKELSQLISKISPLYIEAKNINLIYETNLGWINFNQLNLISKIDKNQALYELNSNSDIFRKAVVKGRFNHKKLFSENSFEIIDLNLSKFEKIDSYGIKKTSFNLKGEVVLEKDTINLVFVGRQPSIFLKRSLSEELKGKYIEGTIVIKPKEIKLDFNPIVLEYPSLKGSFKLDKNLEGYRILAEIENINFSQIKDFLIKFYPKRKEVEQFLKIIKTGEFQKVKIEGSGKDIKKEFNLSNLSLEAFINNGQIEITELPLNFKNIQGEITFKKGILTFNGQSILDDNILLQVKNLNLEFKKTHPFLSMEANFLGAGEDCKNLILKLNKKTEFLKEYTFPNDLEGSIKLSGNLSNISGEIIFIFNNFLVKTPYYKEFILVKKGELIYDFEKIYTKDLKLLVKDSYIEELKGKIDLKTLEAEILAKNLWISEEIIKELSERYPKLKEFISKYHFTSKGVKIDSLNYKENFKTFEKKELIAQGRIFDLTAYIPYQQESFFLEVKELPFEYKKGELFLENALVKIEDSLFELKGKLKEKNWVLEGKGELKEELKKKFEILSKNFAQISLKSPIKFEKFQIIYDNGNFLYSGSHQINEVKISLDLEKIKDFYKYSVNFWGENSDFTFEGEKGSDKIVCDIKGKIDLKEFSELTNQKKYTVSGILETSINFSSPYTSKIKHLRDLLNFYLNSDEFILNGYLNLDKVKYSYNNQFININFLSEFNSKEISISSLDLSWNESKIKGNLKINKKEKYLYLTGDISGNKADLRQILKKEGIEVSEKDLFERLDGMPLTAEVDFYLNNLILPTSHELNEIKGKLNFNNLNKILFIEIPEIYFCGLNLQALYEKTLQEQYIYLEILPSKGDFLDLFSCLYPKEMPNIIFEGPYNLKGFFYAEGDKKEVFKESTGELKIKSNKGYIYRAPLLARIFAFLSPIDLFRGKVPNLETRLLEYEELDVIVFIKDDTLMLNNGFLSAIGFRLFGEGEVNLENKKLDLTFYVSPFKTLDVIVEKVPYLGEWVLGKPRMIFYLPLQVVGTYEKYNIIPLHPSSVGKGIFTFIFRFFGISEEFFQKPPELKKFKKKKEWLKERYEKFPQNP